jgi:transcriptional regulator with XRE-family HTH domain
MAELVLTSGRMEPNPPGIQIDGSELRRRRQLHGENLKAFAERCDITFQYLSQIERGTRRAVSPGVFVRICKALELAKGDRGQLVALQAQVGAA